GSKMAIHYKGDYSTYLMDIDSNTTVYFKVTAVTNGVESDFSSVISATTLPDSSSIVYFPDMSDIPQPDGYSYFYSAKSNVDGDAYVYYYYDYLDTDTFEDMLYDLGYTYEDTTSDGTIFMSKGGNLIGFGYMSDRDCYVIFGNVR
ncbi:MAG: hypothetical protein Q8920_17310, partial [Bacillota bacterium]|nr:hypothetical protein [Bacillota bacterium]